jgi:hypothetical protein
MLNVKSLLMNWENYLLDIIIKVIAKVVADPNYRGSRSQGVKLAWKYENSRCRYGW